MCELFGVSSERKIPVNGYLDVLFKRSVEHRNGWGLALLDDGHVSVEKEPVRAIDSAYLKNRLTAPITTARCMAHIRQATIGDESFSNTHPFVLDDKEGNKWVFVHNGTIFEAPVLSPYFRKQQGTTDSERILHFIVDRVNGLGTMKGCERAKKELIDEIVHLLTPGNKLNFLLWDGSLLYVHKNEPGTLYKKTDSGAAVFATHPLDNGKWEEIPQNRLQIYRNGKLIAEGRPHGNTYHHDEARMRLLYLDHASL